MAWLTHIFNYYKLDSLLNKIKMSQEIKNVRIESLEPSKLSESIKSKQDEKKNDNNSYPIYDLSDNATHTYQEVNKRVITQTQ
jgi:hypothetical protein